MKLTPHERETLDANMESLINRIMNGAEEANDLALRKASLRAMLDTTGMLNVRLSKKIVERLRAMESCPKNS